MRTRLNRNRLAVFPFLAAVQCSTWIGQLACRPTIRTVPASDPRPTQTPKNHIQLRKLIFNLIFKPFGILLFYPVGVGGSLVLCPLRAIQQEFSDWPGAFLSPHTNRLPRTNSSFEGIKVFSVKNSDCTFKIHLLWLG